jgi:hypothetical protein
MGCTDSKTLVLDSISVHSGENLGTGSDIEAAVLAAMSFGPDGALKTKLSLGFKCEGLPNMDTFSKSDPFVVFYQLKGS